MMRNFSQYFGFQNKYQTISNQEIAKLSFALMGATTSGYAVLSYAKKNNQAQQNYFLQNTISASFVALFLAYFVYTLSILKKNPAFSLSKLKKYGNGVFHHSNFGDCIDETVAHNKKTMAFFDLDNTVIITAGYKPNQKEITRKSGYGSDIWFNDMCRKLDKNSPEYKKMCFLLLHEYFEIQRHAHHVTTEDNVAEKLNLLHDNNIPVFGLTARSNGISDVTLERLKALNIRLTVPSDIPVKIEAPAKPDSTDDAVFKQGVIFCSGRSKKLCLEAFVKTKIGAAFFEKAEIVLFVDDRRDYCEEVRDYLLAQGKQEIVVHYTHVEDVVPRATEAEIVEDRKQLSEKLGVPLRF